MKKNTSIVLVIAGIGLFVFFLLFYDTAFPQASFKLDVTRNDAEKIAVSFLDQLGFSIPEGYMLNTTFQSNAKVVSYLQEKLTFDEVNDLIKNELAGWFWLCRWVKNREKEEFIVQVDHKGNVFGFFHLIKEQDQGARLSPEEARILALNFWSKKSRFDQDDFKLIESSSKELENRVDHFFTWSLKKDIENNKLNTLLGQKDVFYKIEVNIQGDKIGSYDQGLKLPEEFERKQTSETSQGMIFVVFNVILTIILLVLAMIIFIRNYKEHKHLIFLSWVVSITVMLIFTFQFLNNIPVMFMNYVTAIDMSIYVMMSVVAAVLGLIIFGLFMFFVTSTGFKLTREVFPGSIGSIDKILKGKLANKDFIYGVVNGYLIAGVFLGYITLFYLIIRAIPGAYVGIKGPYIGAIGAATPFLAPILVSLAAAIIEEFGYRFFTISLIKKYTKQTWLAVLIPAVLWAFGHYSLDINPFFLRFIELIIAGVLFGIFFIRFNLISVIIGHYVIDAVLLSRPLIFSGNLYYIISGIVICLFMALPLIFVLPRYKKNNAKLLVTP